MVWASAVSLQANEKPNIIFILADDLGFNQVGAYGDTPINTPNLDRLASKGIRFTDNGVRSAKQGKPKKHKPSRRPSSLVIRCS